MTRPRILPHEETPRPSVVQELGRVLRIAPESPLFFSEATKNGSMASSATTRPRGLIRVEITVILSQADVRRVRCPCKRESTPPSPRTVSPHMKTMVRPVHFLRSNALQASNRCAAQSLRHKHWLSDGTC